MRDPRGSVLLVDDEERLVKNLARALTGAGLEVTATTSSREAQRLLASRGFDLLIVDNRMPQLTGLELIRELSQQAAEGERPQILLMTAHATLESAIEALRLGAFDYLQKPFEVEELVVAARRALEDQRLRTEHRYLLAERAEEFGNYGIVGSSRAVQELLRTIERIAQSKSTVLVTGETGTGKELVARAIHARSAERAFPLIKVNCAAIPEGLLESELFGHVRGAFTGATSNKRGKFALADGGSIFLDEIGTLSRALQSKLLRALQEREVEPLGSDRALKLDVRVIAATNRDLRRLVGEGSFQEDLYYRLSVIPLAIPPLRERKEDVPLLVAHFLAKHAPRTGKRIDGVSDAALQGLLQYDWPGNVRELENTIERAVVLSAGGRLEASDLFMLGARTSPEPPALPSLRLHDNLEWAEKESLRRALERSRGVKKDAAAMLGISQRALSYYVGKHRLE
ncbi:MAG TPA: sigma-54 dependent transcriptional regulator [Vicinamibacteria bacterium]|nr:sigma-54 dependent transcriptional regulator [Vicinamibacteria bacterium]